VTDSSPGSSDGLVGTDSELIGGAADSTKADTLAEAARRLLIASENEGVETPHLDDLDRALGAYDVAQTHAALAAHDQQDQPKFECPHLWCAYSYGSYDEIVTHVAELHPDQAPDVSPVPLDGEENTAQDPDRATEVPEGWRRIWGAARADARAWRISQGKPATPEGGELEDLLAKADSFTGAGHSPKHIRRFIADLASALRRQTEEVMAHQVGDGYQKGYEHGQLAAERRLERELAEARDTSYGDDVIAEGSLADAVHKSDGIDQVWVELQVVTDDAEFESNLGSRVVVLRATAEGDSK
jgi:hypothetical protein